LTRPQLQRLPQIVFQIKLGTPHDVYYTSPILTGAKE
jgi:hypothetical protein